MAINRFENEFFSVVLSRHSDGKFNVRIYDIENRTGDPFMTMCFSSLILALLAYDEILKEV